MSFTNVDIAQRLLAKSLPYTDCGLNEATITGCTFVSSFLHLNLNGECVEDGRIVNNWRSAQNVDFGYKGRGFEPQHQYVFSLSKRLYPHCFSRLSYEMSTRWGQPREGCSVL